MRLIAPLLFALLGLVVAAIVTRLMHGRGLAFSANAVLGIVGAFAGLWFRDLLDIMSIDPFFGAMLAALIGSSVLIGIVNLPLLAGRRR